MNQKTKVEIISTLTLLEELKLTIDSITQASIDDKGVYGCALRASVAKSFEFACFAYQDPPPTYGFFITATLRGICEDLITFTFLETLSETDRNDAIGLLMSANIAEGLSAQKEFFNLNRPWQPIVEPPTQKTDTEKKLRDLSSKLGWTGKQAWPTVWYMAKATNLNSLYVYLYSSTSKWVHFSPQILLRMGWGGSRDNVGNHTDWKFTTKNFSQYYVEFNRVYSLMLLLKLFDGPAESILPDITQKIISKLKEQLNDPIRWPETVTFEELNLESPSSLSRVFQRIAHENSANEKR